MLKCNNCGAEFSGELTKCPFCGYENTAAVQKNYYEKIDKLIEEREQIKHLPEKKLSKYTKKIMMFALGALVLIVVFWGISFWLRGIEKNRQIETEKENKQIMEEYLANDAYEDFYNFYKNLDYNSSYRKYNEIANVYNAYDNLKYYLEATADSVRSNISVEMKLSSIAGVVRNIRDIYQDVDEYKNDNMRLGNNRELDAVLDMSCFAFLETFPVGEEMLEEILTAPEDETDPKFTALCEEILEMIN
ncbi:MAG: hypothetical protein ACI4GD_12590 [Lachnospiraceae bacterium]